LQDEIRRLLESRYDPRLHGVLLVAQGMSCPEVGGLLGDAPRTVEYWVRRFEEKGLAGLVEGERSGLPRRLNDKQLEEINSVLRQTLKSVGISSGLWDGKGLAAFIKNRYGVTLGVRECQNMFKSFGFRRRKLRPLIAGADPEVQEAYKKLRRIMANPKIDLWATDEVHFQQYGSRCLMWVPPEKKDPVLLHHPTRRSVSYFGAVRLRDGKLVFQREEERFNAVTFHTFLKHLRQVSSRSARRVVVITDNAKYHHARLHAD
jgi:transposase